MKEIKMDTAHLKREAPKHSANDTRAVMWSISKLAATARAKAMPCSFRSTVLRVSRTLRSWTLVKDVNQTLVWIKNSKKNYYSYLLLHLNNSAKLVKVHLHIYKAI